MTEDNIEEVYRLYQNYKSVKEKCAIVSMDQLNETLVPKEYIEKKETEIINSTLIKQEYLMAYNRMIQCEETMKKIINEGGYLDE